MSTSGQQAQRWKLALGANPDAHGTRFRVWAPDVERVEVVFTAGDYAPYELRREHDGYFSGYVRGVAAGTGYKYRLNGGDLFPDPASRYQPEGVHGPSQVVDPAQFAWTDHAWSGIPLEALIIYEVHVGTATPEGTFDALAARLGAIRELGATALQLMALADFPGKRNWGYDGVNIFAPARAYGGPEGLRRLVDAAHAQGLAVIIDVVFNHFGPEGNYLAQYSKDYFIDGDVWGSKRINFVSRSGRPVRDYFVANACHWAHEYHVDGLRLDAIQAISDKDEPHIVSEIATRVRASLPKERSFLIIAEDEYNDPKLVQPVEHNGFGLDGVYADDFHHQVHVAVTGERSGYYMDYGGSIEDLAVTLKQGWWFIGQPSQWRTLKHPEGKPVKVGHRADHVHPAHLLYCIQNHDQVGNRPRGERLSAMVAPNVYRAVSALLLLSPYTPLLFMGQEWAASTPFLFFTDFGDEQVIQGVSAGRPKDMDQLFPGQGAETPNPQEVSTFQRSKLQWHERSQPRHAGILQLYRDLLGLRRTLPALLTCDRHTFKVEALGSDALALRRHGTSPQDTLLVIVNLRDGLKHQLTGTFVTAPPPGFAWQILLDSERPSYGGVGDTQLEQDGLLEMREPGAVLLAPLPLATIAASARTIEAALDAEATAVAGGGAHVLADFLAWAMHQRVGEEPQAADLQVVLRDLLQRYAGREIATGASLLSFGSGSSLGDVTVGDVAGGNINKITVNINF